MIEAYPLSWPAGWPRTKSHERVYPKFGKTERRPSSANPSISWRSKTQLSVYDASWRVLGQLKMMGVDPNDVVISTNVETRQDGLPRSDRRAPDDPGVAVYWPNPATGQSQCMAIDLYETVAGNLAAVAATIEALRAIERHGGAQILKRAFEGFKALPSSTVPALSTEQAADVLARRSDMTWSATEVLRDKDTARDAYRRAAAKAHPDAGGSTTDFQLVQEAKRVLGAHFGTLL